jgi:OOP family OmpA-OmpF porin
VLVSGRQVTVVATESFSGVLHVPFTVTGGGATTSVTVTVTVRPDAVPGATSSPVSAASTRLAWPRSKNATAYRVERSGRVLCRTTSTTCTVAGLFGPASGLKVVALGGAGTSSTPAKARTITPHLVRVAGVHFGIDSAELDATARRTLDQTAATVRRQGFTRLVLVAHTDSQASHQHNVVLSEHRAQATAAYLRHRLRGSGITLSTSYRAETQPVASNRTARGRAENRRTDVWLG